MAENLPAFDDLPAYDNVPPAQEHAQPDSGDASTPQASSALPKFDDLPDFDSIPDKQAPEAEGMLGTAVRKAAYAAAPTLGSLPAMEAGAGAGAALGTLVAPGAGTVIGGLLGGVAAGMGAGYVLDSFQKRALHAIAPEWAEQNEAQMASNAEANPITDVAANIAPMAVAFGPSLSEKLSAYLLRGGAMGALNVGQQYAEKGTVDPEEVAINAAAGAVLNKPRGFAEPYLAAGRKVGTSAVEAFRPGRPDTVQPTKVADTKAVDDANDVTTTNRGVSADNPPVVTPKPGTTGQPVNSWDAEQVLAGARRTFDKDKNIISSTESENPAPDAGPKDTGFSTGPKPTDDPTIASVFSNDYVAPADRASQDQPRQEPIGGTLPPVEDVHAADVNRASAEGAQRAVQGSRGELPADAFEKPDGPQIVKLMRAGFDIKTAEGMASADVPLALKMGPEKWPTESAGKTQADRLAAQDEAAIPAKAKPTEYTAADEAAYERKQAGGQTDFDAAAVGEPAKLKVPKAAAAPEPVAEQPKAATAPQRPRQRITQDEAIQALPKENAKGGQPLPDNSPFKETHGTVENLEAAIKAARSDPNNRVMREAADFADKHLASAKKLKGEPYVLAQLRSSGNPAYIAAAKHIESLPEGPARKMATAKMSAALVNPSGGLKNPGADLKNVRVRKAEALDKLNIDGLTRNGKPVRADTIAEAQTKTKAIEATQKVFNDPKFQPKEGESNGQLRDRAKAMIVAATDHNGGENPLKTYAPSDKPKEWSLLREAQKLVRGKGHTTPDEFRANEALHRGTDEQYDSFKQANKAAADAALNPRKGEEMVAKAEAQQATRAAAAPAETHEEESLYERRIREEKEDKEAAVANAFKGDLSGKPPDKTTAKYLAAQEEKPAGDKSAKQINEEAARARAAQTARLKAAREWKNMSDAEKIAHPEKDPGTMQAMKRPLEDKTEKLRAAIDKKIKDNASAAKAQEDPLALSKKPGYKVGDLSEGLNSFARPPSSSGEDVGRLLASQAETAHHIDVNNSLLLQKDVLSIPEAIRKDTDAQERIYKAIEANKIGTLNARDKGIYDQYVGPIKLATDTIFKNITKRWPNATAGEVMNHIFRITEDTLSGKEGKTYGGASDDPVMSRDLRGATPGTAKARKYFVHEDKDGKRTVISPNDEGYTEYKNGKASKVVDPGYEYEEGKMYGDKKMTGALTEEIEKAAGEKYAKNALLSTYSGLEQMMKLGNHLQLVENFKQNPDFVAHSIPAKAEGAAKRAEEKGYIRTKMASFKDDFYMDPQVAHMMDDYAGPGIDWFNNGFRAFSQGVTKLLFWMPTAHIANVAAHGFVARGWDWVNPAAYPRLVSTSMDAIKSVMQQDHTQTDLYKNNAGLISPGLLTAKPMDTLAKSLSVQIERSPGKWGPIADTVGVPLKKLSDMIYKGSSRVMWAVNDMILTQHIMELKQKNPDWSTRQAITQAEKLIPNYRTPTNVMSDKGFGRAFAQVIREPSLVAFGPYHYGMINAFAHMAKDLYKGNSKERTDALGNVMALGVLAFAVKPLFDQAARMVTGNQDAEVHARGPLTVPNTINEVREGRTDPMQVLRDTLTLSPITAAGIGALGGRDWTGHAIVEPGDIANAAHGDYQAAGRAAAQAGDFAARGLVSPYNTYANAQSKGIGVLGAIRDQALDIKNPSDAASKFQSQLEKHNAAQSKARQKKGGRGPLERAWNNITQ